MKYIFILFISALHIKLYAHSGGVIKSGIFKGCHQSHKHHKFHCHSKSPYNGLKWSSKELAFKDITNDSPKQESKKRKSSYDRSSWGNWNDPDGNCLNTRHEILKQRSLIKTKIKNCNIVSGKWQDFFYNETLSDTKNIDIDHIVPLRHAHDHGAQTWKASKKRAFFLDPENLVITNKSYNRQKGSKSITEWMPLDRQYSCKYFKKWNLIKKKYHLTITKIEKQYFQKLNCK